MISSYFNIDTQDMTGCYGTSWPIVQQRYASRPSDHSNFSKIVSKYDPEIPHSQTADNPVASQGSVKQQSRDTKKTNKAKQPALLLIDKLHIPTIGV